MSAFCNSGVSLSKLRQTLSPHIDISGHNVLDEGICLEYDWRTEQKYCQGITLEQLRLDEGICLEYDWRTEQKNCQGITLEQLRNRSMEQKLKDLEQIDWRSQILESRLLK